MRISDACENESMSMARRLQSIFTSSVILAAEKCRSSRVIDIRSAGSCFYLCSDNTVIILLDGCWQRVLYEKGPLYQMLQTGTQMTGQSYNQHGSKGDSKEMILRNVLYSWVLLNSFTSLDQSYRQPCTPQVKHQLHWYKLPIHPGTDWVAGIKAVDRQSKLLYQSVNKKKTGTIVWEIQ